MRLLARARLIAVLVILAGGAVVLISSTQTWFDLTLVDSPDVAVAVSGTSALPVLAPLALAAMALGLALAIAGRVLAIVLGVIGLAIGVVLTVLTAPIALSAPPSALARTVAEHTGITGAAVPDLVASATPTPWPWLATLAAGFIALATLWAVATAPRWARAGRRYSTEGSAPAAPTPAAEADPAASVDAIDAWDDLSRGDDPTGTAR